MAPSGDCASHSVNYANHINISHSPGGGTSLETTLYPLSFGKSFMKIRSAVPENGFLIFLTDGKKTKKNKKQKTSAKHIRIRLLPEGGCVNEDIQHTTTRSEPTTTAGDTVVVYLSISRRRVLVKCVWCLPCLNLQLACLSSNLLTN